MLDQGQEPLTHLRCELPDAIVVDTHFDHRTAGGSQLFVESGDEQAVAARRHESQQGVCVLVLLSHLDDR
jgi:hypothetical protein